jgi:dCMP deaminase
MAALNKWNTRYLNLARDISEWSKDPNTKVGCVVVGSKGQILSQGYNGFPRGINDMPGRLNDRDTKLTYTIHAEMNAIFNASYSGISLNGASLYVFGLPICSECAKGVIQVGISKVYVSKSCINARPHWNESWLKSRDMFLEAGVIVNIINDNDL